MRGVYPPLLKWGRRFIAECKDMGIPLVLLEAKRSNDRQAQLFAEGASQVPRDGAHVNGYALDLVHGVRWWADMTEDDWLMLSEIGKEHALQRGLKLTWGGDWRFYDAAHWEVTGWRDLPAIP